MARRDPRSTRMKWFAWPTSSCREKAQGDAPESARQAHFRGFMPPLGALHRGSLSAMRAQVGGLLRNASARRGFGRAPPGLAAVLAPSVGGALLC